MDYYTEYIKSFCSSRKKSEIIRKVCKNIARQLKEEMQIPIPLFYLSSKPEQNQEKATK